MKKTICFVLTAAAIFFIWQNPGTANNVSNIFDKIKLLDSDIPDGFMYGKVPAFAKTVLKDNPWEFDRAAIKKLADQIYPDGDYSKILGIHMSILARNETPHGDDIVCYIIIFRDASSAKGELKKMREYAKYNGDRVVLEIKDNTAVFLHVDDVRNFPLIRAMGEKIRERLMGIRG